MTDRFLTDDELAKIRASYISLTKQYAPDVASWVIYEDVPRLLEEIQHYKAWAAQAWPEEKK